MRLPAEVVVATTLCLLVGSTFADTLSPEMLGESAGRAVKYAAKASPEDKAKSATKEALAAHDDFMKAAKDKGVEPKSLSKDTVLNLTPLYTAPADISATKTAAKNSECSSCPASCMA